MEELIKKFVKAFKEGEVMPFLEQHLHQVSHQLIYAALLLYYAFREKDTPKWAKNVVIGSLGYLLAPIDVLPDLTPFLGLTDDFGVLSFALVMIACYINEDVRYVARKRLYKMVKKPNLESLDEIDSWL